MNLSPYEKLSSQQVRYSLNNFIKEGIITEIMINFASGTFLTSLLISIGITNFQFGLLASISCAFPVFQLLSIWLIQRFRNRKVICMGALVVARLPLFIIGSFAFFNIHFSLYLILSLTLIEGVFGSVAGVSWNSWIRDVVPENSMGKYFAKRGRIIQIVSVSLTLLLALVLKFFKVGTFFYSIMFLSAGVIGMYGVFILSRSSEPRTEVEKKNVFVLFVQPMKNKKFNRLVIFESAWIFFSGLIVPFCIIYEMKVLHLSLSFILISGIIGRVVSILSMKMWGKFSDVNNIKVVMVCGMLISLNFFIWSVAYTPFIVILIQVIGGFASAGFDLSINNYFLKIIPKNQAIIYLPCRNILFALVGIIAPLTGGILMLYFDWRMFFILGGVLSTLSLILLKWID